MDAVPVLLANGYFLSFVLLVLLIALASRNGLHKKTKKINKDLKKIKEQISDED